MKSLKTDDIKIEVVICNDDVRILKGKRVIVRVNGTQETVISSIFPQDIIKSKFADASFFRHIINFLIKD